MLILDQMIFLNKTKTGKETKKKLVNLENKTKMF